MTIKNFIFLLFVLSLALIESKRGYSSPGLGRKIEQSVGFISGNGFELPRSKDALMENSNEPKLSSPAEPPKVVLNEILSDPTPVVGLPDREYIELYNPGISPVNLKGWLLGLGSKQKVVPDVSIAAGGYLLLTGTGGTTDLQLFGKVVEISGFSVTNAGMTITLSDPEKKCTDQLVYTPDLHGKNFQEGGYSLERIDAGRTCGQKYNWATSISAKGGTPGFKNSVEATNPDNVSPQMVNSSFIGNARLDIQLSESFLCPGKPIDRFKNISPELVIDSIIPDLANCLLHVYFNPESVRNGIEYSVILSGITDECGNLMSDQRIPFGYYLPVSSDLLINEVLFNPFPDGSDFVEIYNNSGHQVDLSGLWLATRDASNVLTQLSQIAPTQKYLPAFSYLALTKSIDGVLKFYRPQGSETLVQMEKFPSLADQSGCVAILNQNKEIIDEMNYSEAMHHPFISEKEGISLERIRFTAPSMRKETWHSAAKSAGFATPGYKNSAIEVADSSEQWVRLEPLVFSPNGDGINDKLNIYINTSEPGWILNITILNYAGTVIRKLANNFTTGVADQLYWDGLAADFQKVQPGIYILQVSLFERTGRCQSKRFACVVTDHP